MSSRDGKRRRALSPEERVLWASVTKTILPLREASAGHEDDAAETAAPAQSPPPSARSIRIGSIVAENKPTPLVPLGRRLKKRVGRGKETIDGRLDLHGLTQSQAHAALLHFLRSASARGARLVLVVTGKGTRAGEGERGVLKRTVPQWLGLPEFRAFVIGYEDAHVSHGGEGALYIRIRRARGGST
jgi:DNA-nicking Smr family endonuclease